MEKRLGFKQKIRRSATQARQQIDQVLLGLGHSSFKNLKDLLGRDENSDDLIKLVGRRVLERADIATRKTGRKLKRAWKGRRTQGREKT